MIYNAKYHSDHEYVDQDGCHWHLMIADRSGECLCIDVFRMEGRVFTVGSYKPASSGISEMVSLAA